jgi:hypothetical protein
MVAPNVMELLGMKCKNCKNKDICSDREAKYTNPAIRCPTNWFNVVGCKDKRKTLLIRYWEDVD